MRKTALFWECLLMAILMSACSKKPKESQEQTQQLQVDSAAGVHWTVPEHWSQGPRQPMRVVTYALPSPRENVEAGECAVFFFGSGQGGTVQDNLSRWISQFKNGGDHQFSTKEVNDLKLTSIQIKGTYLAPSGPMMASTGERPDYRLLGAIVEAPEGLVFFKVVGPLVTVDSNELRFNSLIASLAKDQSLPAPSLSSGK